MADKYDPMKDPSKHVAPDKTLIDKIIEAALGAGGGAVTLLSGLLAAVLIMYSGYVLFDTYATERAASSNAWDLLQFRPDIFDDSDTLLGADDIAGINKDYCAWLTVYGTPIDYPVVQGPNDTYYAAVDIYGNSSLTGAIYLAAANSRDFSDSYNVIYGHHMDNGAMFGSLDSMTGSETGLIVTDNEIYDVQFFAVALTDAYENRIYSAGNRMNDVLSFLRSGGEGGVGIGTTVTYFNEEAVTDATKVVALSTCVNAATNGRVVVFGTMTKRVVMTDVTIVKVWNDNENQDGKRPASLTVTLSSGDTAVLTADNGWTATLTVPKYDNLGAITYTWTEESVIGYDLTGTAYNAETGTTTLTNTHIPATTSVSVSKQWVDGGDRDRLRPGSVTAILSNGMTVPLSESNNWSATVNNLPVYNAGQEIEYTWTEADVPGYDLKVNGNVLINTHKPATVTLSVSKIWVDGDDQDGIRPKSLTVTLYGDDQPVGSVTLSDSNDWSDEIEDLFVYEAGKPIVYRWEEDSVKGYTLSEKRVKGTATTLTNTHVPATVDLTVSKVWDDNNDQDRVRPRSLRVDLSNGRWVTLNKGNDWTETITDLPKYAAGQEIEYTWTEAGITGYEQTGMTVSGYTTVITNRHETDKTVATLVKVWDDDGDRDGIRPGSVTAVLSSGQKVTLNDANNWTATVTGLPMNADGDPIPYTWTEEAVDGYTSVSSVSGTITTLTNTHKIDTVDLIVKKVWADNDDQDGIRPGSVTVTLNAGDEAVASFTLNAADNWTATAEGLPVNAGGKPIAYSWTEEEIDGYTLTVFSSGNTTTLTNTHVPATVDLTVTKVWDDNDDQDGLRPENLTVTLSSGEKVILTAENGWTATVTDLPVCLSGAAVDYHWTEEAVDGYTLTSAAVSGTVTVLTNTHAPAVTKLTVIKVWDDDGDRDALRPSTLAVSLLADGKAVRSVSLNAVNRWTAAFEDLPVYENGSEIAYAWSEDTVADYSLSISVDGNVTTLTNTHVPANVNLTVQKIWDDDDDRDGLRPDDLIVTLRGDDESIRQLTLSGGNGWKASVEVPANHRGRAIKYTWDEAAVAYYTCSQATEGSVTTFTNTHVPALTARSVAKVWDDADDQDGVRPDSVTVWLLADRERIAAIELNEENGWTYTADALHVHDGGKAVKYSWEEEPVPGYPAVKTSVAGHLTAFTNTHVPEVTEKRVMKVWDDLGDLSGFRPETLTVTLLADGEPVGSVELNAGNDWTGAIAGLPVYANGKAVEYSWDEGEVKGYAAHVSTAGDMTVITNRRDSELTVATVVKVWDDDDDRDGIRPEKLIMTLNTGDTVELNAGNHWTGTISGLRKYSDGVEIEYTWSEEPVKGYKLVSTVRNGTVTTVTNRHDIAKQKLTVVKVWDDDDDRDGLRPESLRVTLNGKKTVVLNEKNGWTASVDDQPVYADGGRILIYRWREEPVEGYHLTTEVNGTVTTLTNTRTPAAVDLTVRKVWVDEDDSARPDSLIMVLYGGGTVRTVTLSASNNWTATIAGLPRDAAGQEIEYTWTEPVIKGYTLRSVVTSDGVTTFTNVRNAGGDDTDHLLTIYYRYPDGSTAGGTYIRVYKAGDTYDVPSPIIPGFRAVPVSVTGIMPARDVTYTVIYVPDDVIVDDPGTPGLGGVTVNVGECLE